MDSHETASVYVNAGLTVKRCNKEVQSYQLLRRKHLQLEVGSRETAGQSVELCTLMSTKRAYTKGDEPAHLNRLPSEGHTRQHLLARVALLDEIEQGEIGDERRGHQRRANGDAFRVSLVVVDKEDQAGRGTGDVVDLEHANDVGGKLPVAGDVFAVRVDDGRGGMENLTGLAEGGGQLKRGTGVVDEGQPDCRVRHCRG